MIENKIKIIIPEDIGTLNEKYIMDFIKKTISQNPELSGKYQYVFIESKDDFNVSVKFLDKQMIDKISQEYNILPEEIVLFLFGKINIELSEENKGKIISQVNGLQIEWASE